jgi:hypothetical protein
MHVDLAGSLIINTSVSSNVAEMSMTDGASILDDTDAPGPESARTRSAGVSRVRPHLNELRKWPTVPKGDIVASIAWTLFPDRASDGNLHRRRELAVALGGAEPAPGEVS